MKKLSLLISFELLAFTVSAGTRHVETAMGYGKTAEDAQQNARRKIASQGKSICSVESADSQMIDKDHWVYTLVFLTD